MPGSSAWSRISRSTSTCWPRRSGERVEAHTATGVGAVVPGHLRHRRSSCVWACPVQSDRVVSPEPGAGSDRVTGANPRARPCAAAVRVLANLGAPAPGGMARESYARAAALSGGRLAGADARGATRTHRAASRARADADRPDRALEHGLRV